MVHRPSDSRLLVNLLNHEKDYSKQLSSLLDHSQSSLASFSAYASSSAPPTSQIIIQVAGALAGADEALRKYAGSLEQWQEQLKSLKALEDGVGNIMRDREILVTRLIKLSKSQKPTRDSILASSSSSTLTKLPEVQTSTKLAAAQSELQACEAHLAAKERELDVMRNAAILAGLGARCKALVECGWTWGEMGKEGLRALESTEASAPAIGNGMANGYAHTSPTLQTYKPLPDGPPSDLSSIGPSQSASQTTHGMSEPVTSVPPKLHIPPAYSISDQTFPVEEELGEGSSVGEEEGDYELRENERFSKRSSKISSKPKANGHANTDSREKFSSVSSFSTPPNQIPKRTRRTSGSVLGSIAAFFHRSPADSGSQGGSDSSPTKKRGRWQTRTDKHIADARNGKDPDSDDDATVHQRSPVLAAGSSRPPAVTGTSHKLKKHTGESLKQNAARTTDSGVPGSVELGQGVFSDGEVDRRTSRRGKKIRRASADQPLSEPESSHQTVKRPKSSITPQAIEYRGKDAPPTTLTTTTPDKVRKSSIGQGQNKSNGALHAALPTETPLSRNSSLSKRSITSAASAPVNLSGLPSKGTIAIYPALSPSDRQTPSHSAHKRSASLDAKPHESSAPVKGSSKKSKRGQSISTHPAHTFTIANHKTGSQSLMSIVEDVAQHNRDYRMKQDPNAMLVMAKAPPPLSHDLLMLPDEPMHPSNIIASSSHTPAAPKSLPSRDKTASQRSIPLTPTVPTPSVPVTHTPSSDKKPLRSAMRNSSRSPSPIVNPLPPTIPARSKLRPPPSPDVRLAAPLPSDTSPPLHSPIDNDSASISSYETTHEMLMDESEEEEMDATLRGTLPALVQPPLEAAPSPPPKDTTAPASDISQHSQSTGSTTLATNSTSPPVRRKSVRMSLPPTFSTTPPAIDDDGDEHERGRRHEPWSHPRNIDNAGWRSKVNAPVERDVWHDSSESEDEEYSKAKRLLGRLSRKK